MNAVWNSYGQLCGCPEIFKKSCKFFCRGLDIRVPHVMKTHMLCADFFDDPVVQPAESVRVPRLACARRWKQIWIYRMSFVLLYEKLYRFFWQ